MSEARKRIDLRTANDVWQGDTLTAERLRERGMVVTDEQVREAPAVICARSLVRQIVQSHPEITPDTAVDLDVGHAVVNPSAIYEFWQHWPLACFITEEQDTQEAIDLVTKRLGR